MSKTMSVRMDRDNYQFLHEITKESLAEAEARWRALGAVLGL
jgi:hypothetical protein